MTDSKKIYKCAAVSYLNTKPLLHGIVHDAIEKQLEIELAIPSRCADKLIAGEVDFALVPVAVIPTLSEAQIISDFCIGTEGAVRTVAIFSEVPIHEIEAIYLDFHSRTSVQLCQILCREYWKINPQFIPAQKGFIDEIAGKTAALVIGDRTIVLEEKFSYQYDLGTAWLAHTGLPFVFAAWVSRRALPPAFMERLNQAMQTGIDSISKLVYLLPKPHPNFDVQEYFEHYINYHLDAPKRQALDLFFQKMKENQLLTATFL